MRFSEDGLIQEFLELYDSLPVRDRESLPIEAIAIAANINPSHLLGEIMLAMRDHSVNEVKIAAIAAHPKIMRQQVKHAMTQDGYNDRRDLNMMLGALPSPKGPTFINRYFAGNQKDESEGIEEAVTDVDAVFTPCHLTQQKVQPLRQKLLEGRK